MKTKEEAIQEAYGEYWDELPLETQKEALENNGWINKYYLSIEFRNQNYNECKQIDIVTGQSWAYRPKSLQGIENNNEWIRIESELDKPKEDCDCYFKTYSEEIFLGQYVKDLDNFRNVLYNKLHYGDVSHYKPIEKPKPPIY